MALHWLFPTPVLQVDLELDATTAAPMQQQLEQFDAQVYQHPEFSDRKIFPAICWPMPASISCIAWMRSSG